MSLEVTIRNRQRTKAVSVAGLRRIARTLFNELLSVEGGELGVILVSSDEITKLNETFLQHAGSTDVITFNYGKPTPRTANPLPRLEGEVFVCVDEAIRQARRFRTTWSEELVRYVVHGALHLCGYDDSRAADRRRMKREEDRLVKELARRFSFSRLTSGSKDAALNRIFHTRRDPSG